VAAIICLVSKLRSKAKARPEVSSDSFPSQDLVSKVQEGLLCYNAGVTVLALKYGEAMTVDDKISMIWSIYV
jgi:hypothetical protein